MGRRSSDGTGLLEAFRAGVASLETHVDEVNSLNVFPVPDGDTGSNMLATVRAALDEAERLGPDAPADRVAAAISFGALMGARGNSGVITSQILRGLAEGLAGKRHFNGLDLAYALREGSRTAYGAVAKPVEGTILTVIRESADAAVERAEEENDLDAVMTATLEAAERSVARTPTLLPVLHEAGVVDSGGQGLYRIFQGLAQHLAGRAAPRRTPARAAEPASVPALVAEGEAEFGYETMFLLHARPAEQLDVDAIRFHLETLGESVLVAGDPRALKVHVHNERPDLVIAYGLGLGTLSRVTVENLDGQAREVRERAAAAFTGEGWSPPASPAPAVGSASSGGAAPDVGSTAQLPLGVVAVAAGEGLGKLFEQFRMPYRLAVTVVRGGQSHNPSTGEMLDAIAGLPAEEVLILPNNPNVVLAARQVAELADRACRVVPTRNAAEGVAAMLALDPTVSAAANVEPMTEAARTVQTIQVTEAIRDARFGERKVRRGQTIVLDPDDGLVSADQDRTKAILAGVAAFTPGYELITVYYGDGADLDEAEATAHRIGEAVSPAEVQLVHGGQPYYRYLISAE